MSQYTVVLPVQGGSSEEPSRNVGEIVSAARFRERLSGGVVKAPFHVTVVHLVLLDSGRELPPRLGLVEG